MIDSQELRLKIVLRGAVQGVGFRPFVYRLARELKLTGWVRNSAEGVFIEAEGPRSRLEQFLIRIEKERPSPAVIHNLEPSFHDRRGYPAFEIRESLDGDKTVTMLPDIATCEDCLHELFDPSNRRYHYPFINCTHCGPRYSIIESLPYDRARTVMKKFVMCRNCQTEYNDPTDRRFHAQPNACPDCGPQVQLWDQRGNTVAAGDQAINEAARQIQSGKIMALKGLGGFQLLVNAMDSQALRRLRARKHREEKPFAVMMDLLAEVEKHCFVSALERRLLSAGEAPIVLLDRRQNSILSSCIAPSNPCLGIMLPYTPLHHLLIKKVAMPVVATSGNLSEESMCVDEQEALERLGGIADAFLVHDRPIRRPVDDSVARIMLDREMILRRARGYASLPFQGGGAGEVWLAAGAHLKSTVAVAKAGRIFVSPYVGDLDEEKTYRTYHQSVSDLKEVYEVNPEKVVCDLHPDYRSTQYAEQTGLPLTRVQHHYAHVLACMAENEIEAPVLGVAWDGAGLGSDHTLWGGEFLLVDETSFQRAGHFRTFRLPGGDKAAREPRRSALGLLYEMEKEDLWNRKDCASLTAFSPEELRMLRGMLERNVNVPVTSSVGRLFDAVASMIGLRQIARFEGQAPMELEFALREQSGREEYPAPLLDGLATVIVDWEPMILELLRDFNQGASAALISLKFHNTLSGVIVAMAGRLKARRVVLTGGCFQNKFLTERAVQRLAENGFCPYWHQRIPPNDAGVSLGQMIALSRQSRKEEAYVSGSTR